MFVIIAPFLRLHVLIGSLVMYSYLLVLCIYVNCRRSSKNANSTLYITSAVSIFGVVSSALQLHVSYAGRFVDTEKTLIAGLFFAMTLTPLIWMVGISLFSVLLKDQKKKKPVQVLLGYVLTAIQFVLIVVCTVYIGKFMHDTYSSYDYDTSYISYDSIAALHIYHDLFTSIISINWGFFLLLVWLVIQYRSFIPRSIIITMAIFIVLNTARLITETIFLMPVEGLSMRGMFYIMFFFTDFISCISLYMTIFSWRNVQETKHSEQLVE